MSGIPNKFSPRNFIAIIIHAGFLLLLPPLFSPVAAIVNVYSRCPYLLQLIPSLEAPNFPGPSKEIRPLPSIFPMTSERTCNSVRPLPALFCEPPSSLLTLVHRRVPNPRFPPFDSAVGSLLHYETPPLSDDAGDGGPPHFDYFTPSLNSLIPSQISVPVPFSPSFPC